MAETKRVLILEPNLDLEKTWRDELQGFVHVTMATALLEAMQKIDDKESKFDAIVITLADVETVLWVEEIGRTFGGLIVGASDLDTARRILSRGRCNVVCEKDIAASVVLDRLGF